MHTHTQTRPLWLVHPEGLGNIFQVRPGATGPVGPLANTAVEFQTGAQHTTLLPSLSRGKKKNTFGVIVNIHTPLHQQTQSQWHADTHTTPYINILYTPARIMASS